MPVETLFCPCCNQNVDVDVNETTIRLTEPKHTVRCPQCSELIEIED